MKKTCESIIHFLHVAEQLKQECRHSWTSIGRQESVAEHSWRVALMLLVCTPYLSEQIDVLKALQLAILHDLGEITVGDKHYLDINSDVRAKAERALLEREAVAGLASLLGTKGSAINEAFQEFECQTSAEAKVVYFLDKLEACMQHNEAELNTWSQREIDSIEGYFADLNSNDPFLVLLKEAVYMETMEKLRKIKNDSISL